MADNPYAPPKSHVADAPTMLPDGEFIPGGRGVSAGQGWRWIADAWAFTAQQRGTFIGVFVLFVLVGILVSIVPILGSIAGALLMPVLNGGFVLGMDAVRRGERLEVGHLFAGFQNHAGKLITLGGISLGAVICMVLIVTVIFGSTIGMVFLGGAQPSPEEISTIFVSFLLAALIMLALSLPLYMALWFAGPLIVLGQSDVVPALKTSFSACLKNVLPFLVWSVAIVILAVVATIPLLLGWLLLGPVMMASIYLSYRDIFHDV